MQGSVSTEVVITGMGAISPLGLNTAETWRALQQGHSVRAPITLFPTEGCRCQDGAQTPLPPPTRTQRRLSRASRLALLAAEEALAQAGLLGHSLLETLPLCLSTTGGAMEWGESFLQGLLRGQRHHLLGQIARYQPQQQALDLQEKLQLHGPVLLIGNACASGANAIGHGFDLIQTGLAEAVLVGGFEALTELIFVGFDSLQALSPEACRPFDEHRNGLMLGEGAAFLVLESRTHAERRGRGRGADILGRLRGYGHSTDLHHLTQPHPTGHSLVVAMQDALTGANLRADEIVYINAHGTGTPMNDGAEALAYQTVMGEHLPNVVVSSTKSAIGHTLGAAGCLEAVFALCAAREAWAPPQLNHQTPLTTVPLHLAQPSQKIPRGQPVMSVNLGFGGSNAALIFSL